MSTSCFCAFAVAQYSAFSLPFIPAGTLLFCQKSRVECPYDRISCCTILEYGVAFYSYVVHECTYNDASSYKHKGFILEERALRF